MMNDEDFSDILQRPNSLLQLMRRLDTIYNTDQPEYHIRPSVDLQFLSELDELSSLPDMHVQVHDTGIVRVRLRDDGDREHTAVVVRKGEGRYAIGDTSVPYGSCQEEVYTQLTSAVESFRLFVQSLQDYFGELQRIDSACWVVDPTNPTFKDDYRKIVLEDRVWLHVEVSTEGAAAGRLRVVGASAAAQRWNDKLSGRLTLWDTSLSVLDNISHILEVDEFPQAPEQTSQLSVDTSLDDGYTCAICLCADIGRGPPQPLCPSIQCGSYLHTACLAQWLVAASGGVVPKLGVVSGKCPCCLVPISVSENV